MSIPGFCFSAQAQLKFQSGSLFRFEEPFDMLDLVDLGDRVVHMDVVSLSQVCVILFHFYSFNDFDIISRGIFYFINRFAKPSLKL
jgi:hypothetical protein